MKQPTLYIFIGHPGAGKTAVSKIIEEATGAKHLWADHERLKLFTKPTHSEAESIQLYNQLNAAAAYLLEHGKDVIFDTNFNYRSDREKLREIADKAHALTQTIWITTPLEIAKQRAVHDNNLRNGYESLMTEDQFDAIAAKLEEPNDEENVLKIDVTTFDKATILKNLGFKK